MIASASLRFGMVGAGGIAQAYAQAFRDTNIANLVAVADVRTESAEAIAQSLGANSYATHDEMVDAENLDAVVVCTPPVTHRNICADLANRGLHVLCEKPLAIDSKSAREMYEAAAQNNVKLTMATKFRYAADVIRAKAIVSSGILGDVILFENCFTGHVDMSQRWNSNPAVSGGGVLIDNGTHSVDLIRYFLGPVAEVQVVEGRRIQQLDVEDTVRMFVRTHDGVMGSIDLSWSMNKEQPYYLSIYGSQGTVLVGWKESKYRRSNDTDWVSFGEGYNKFQAFRGQIENFTRAIRGEDKLLVTPDDALASVEVIETAYDSLHKSVWQPVKHTEWRASNVDAENLVAAAGQVS
jgi:predicted dehydrogenase